MLEDVHRDVMFSRYHARYEWGNKAWKKPCLQMQQEYKSVPAAREKMLDKAAYQSEFEKILENKAGGAQLGSATSLQYLEKPQHDRSSIYHKWEGSTTVINTVETSPVSAFLLPIVRRRCSPPCAPSRRRQIQGAARHAKRRVGLHPRSRPFHESRRPQERHGPCASRER